MSRMIERNGFKLEVEPVPALRGGDGSRAVVAVLRSPDGVVWVASGPERAVIAELEVCMFRKLAGAPAISPISCFPLGTETAMIDREVERHREAMLVTAPLALEQLKREQSDVLRSTIASRLRGLGIEVVEVGGLGCDDAACPECRPATARAGAGGRSPLG